MPPSVRAAAGRPLNAGGLAGAIASARTGFAWLRSPYALLDQRLARRELTFRLRLPVVGPCLVTGDPALIGEIARNRSLAGGHGTEALRPVVGDDSLIALVGPRHQAHRAALLPHFFSGDAGLQLAQVRRWTRRLIDGLAVDTPFNGSELAGAITLNAMVETIFGPLDADQQDEIVGGVQAWLASFRNPAVLFLKPLHVDLGRFSGWGRFLANRARVHAFIRRRMAWTLAGHAGGGVLGELLRAREAGTLAMDDGELLSEVVTFLLFGHDTSAQAMGWVFHHLWNDPAALARATQEAVAAEASGAAEDGLPFLRSAIQESLRLCPVVVHLTRHALADTQVGPHAVPRDTRVLPCLYLAHRNPEVFDEPTHYRPGRFLQPQAHWRNAYFPFGLGDRLCAGMPLALRQMIAVAAGLMAHCTLETVEPGLVQPVRKMVLIVPSGGPAMRRTA
jgi:cytochrome P450